MTEKREQYDAGAIAQLESQLRILKSRVEALDAIAGGALETAGALARENAQLKDKLAQVEDALSRALDGVTGIAT